MGKLSNSAEQTPARLEFQNVTVAYGSKTILDNITFQVPHGARLAVVGPNGAGKSTLFKAMVGLLPIQNGQIFIHGKPLRSHVDCVAYVPQREEVDWRFPVTVTDVVMMGRYGKMNWINSPNKEDKKAVMRSLEMLDIQDLAKRPIHHLSGGQQQRVFLARALAQQPHILLMDEPFSGVDFATQETTLRLLDDLKRDQVTVIVSTHDLNLARERFDLVLLLNRSLVAFGHPNEIFTTGLIREAFNTQVMVLDGAVVIDQCCDHDDHEEEG
jgi:ABC-type Mn2+/Zn2+ transport system ATPase subunit